MNHSPNCSSNQPIYNSDGVCTGYKACDCGSKEVSRCCDLCFESKADGGACDLTCICHEVKTSNDLIEKIVEEYRFKMGEIGMKREWQIGDEWLRTTLTSFEAKIREEENDCTCKEKWTFGVVHLKNAPCHWPAKHDAQKDAYKEGRREALEELEDKMSKMEYSADARSLFSRIISMIKAMKI